MQFIFFFQLPPLEEEACNAEMSPHFSILCKKKELVREYKGRNQLPQAGRSKSYTATLPGPSQNRSRLSS
jgi:hypothetical protein